MTSPIPVRAPHQWLGRSSSRISLRGCLLPLALMAAFAVATPAQQRLTSLGEMIADAGTIVSGKVLDVREGAHPDYPNVEVTFVTLRVEESFKGEAARQSQFTFMQFGGTGVTRVQELPIFRRNESVLVFLYAKSQFGFTSPVGGSQGKFRIMKDPMSGGSRIANGLDNKGLFHDLGPNSSGLTSEEQSVIARQRGPVDYAMFSSVLRKLTAKSSH